MATFRRWLRHLALGSLETFAVALLRLWMATIRPEVHEPPNQEGTFDPLRPECGGPHVYLIWHEILLWPAVIYGQARLYSLVSSSEDGELAARMMQRCGWRLLRGSSSRGAVQALRQALRTTSGEAGTHMALTVDGPRGPRRVLKGGAIFLASRAEVRLVPVGIAYSSGWRIKSWDQMVLPKPFCRVVLVFGEPIALDRGLNREGLEMAVSRSQAEMDRLTEKAEEYAGVRKVEDSSKGRRAA